MEHILISLQNNVFSTQNGPIKVDGHDYKITDLDKIYFSTSSNFYHSNFAKTLTSL